MQFCEIHMFFFCFVFLNYYQDQTIFQNLFVRILDFMSSYPARTCMKSFIGKGKAAALAACQER